MNALLTRFILAISLFTFTTPTFCFDSVLQDTEKLMQEVTAEKDAIEKDLALVDSQIKAETDQTKKEVFKKSRDDLEKKKISVSQKLDAFTRIRSELFNTDPVQRLIAEYKSALEQIPANGDPKRNEQRAYYDNQIKRLEKSINSENDNQAGPVLAVALIIIFIALGIAAWHILNKTDSSAKNEADEEAVARVRLAKLMTQGAMVLIVFLSGLTLLFAGLNAAFAPSDSTDRAQFFDIAKWILATVLPVVAAWVGGVMAYYFGKENFRAGAELVEKLKQTPQQKLEALKAGESGLEINDKIASYKLNGNLLDANLTEIEGAFTKGDKTYERLPILDDKGCVQGCLHLSTLKKYKDTLNEQDKQEESAKMKLGALIANLPWNEKKSFNTIWPTDNLIRVQALINATPECKDIFVTEDGSASKPAKRWITDDDIIKITNV
jgi:hypothetical protein